MALTRINNQALTNVTSAGLPSGTVLQVKQSQITTTKSTTSAATATDVGLSVTITPSSTSSKILVTVNGVLGNTNTGNATIVHLLRGTTKIGAGTGSSTTNYNNNAFHITGEDYSTDGFSISELDSPATTSAVTYKIQLFAYNGTARLGGRGDSPNSQSAPTTMTVMEIAG